MNILLTLFKKGDIFIFVAWTLCQACSGILRTAVNPFCDSFGPFAGGGARRMPRSLRPANPQRGIFIMGKEKLLELKNITLSYDQDCILAVSYTHLDVYKRQRCARQTVFRLTFRSAIFRR